MDDRLDTEFWDRFVKTTGFAGCLAFILVFFAAMQNGRFDWSVFLFALTALFICWARTWILVPIHLRNERAEADQWNRYVETDWRYVEALSDLSGSEIDALRTIFKSGDDCAARAYVQEYFAEFDSEEAQNFIRFFNDIFMDAASAFVADQGRLRPYD